MCCWFDPADYRGGPGPEEERPTSADEPEGEVVDPLTEEEAHRCC